jgi:hypothetical protein
MKIKNEVNHILYKDHKKAMIIVVILIIAIIL